MTEDFVTPRMFTNFKFNVVQVACSDSNNNRKTKKSKLVCMKESHTIASRGRLNASNLPSIEQFNKVLGFQLQRSGI